MNLKENFTPPAQPPSSPSAPPQRADQNARPPYPSGGRRWRAALRRGSLAWIAFLLATAPAVLHSQVTLMWTRSQGYCNTVTIPFPCYGNGDAFGIVLVPLGGGRFAAGLPKADFADIYGNPPMPIPDAGYVQFWDSTGDFPAGTGLTSLVTNGISAGEFGSAIAGMADGTVLASGPTTAAKAGVVYLLKPQGRFQPVTTVRTWNNPAGPAGSNTYFGHALAALPGNRFAASALQGSGRVYLFDASTVAAPQLTITDPTPGVPGPGSGSPNPWSGTFGSVLTTLGTNRLLVAEPHDSFAGDNAGTVFVYDLAGHLLRMIHNFTGKPDEFGAALVAVDDHRFLVGAPLKDETYLAGNLFTNENAGAVYLYDDAGTLLRTFRAPDVAASGNFGRAIALLGPARVLIGSPGERIGATTAGRVHLFNLEGLHLESMDNPTPVPGDGFGAAVVAADERHFAVGAPGDDPVITNIFGVANAFVDSGSIYGFDAPSPAAELGSEIPRPNNIDASGIFPTQGPTVNPPGAAFWHAASQKLFAVRPGSVLVTWPLLNGQTFNWQGILDWPTNRALFQTHLAGPTAVDLSDGGRFSSTLLQATTSAVDADVVRQTRTFTATIPGLSLLLLSSGNPSSNAIQFQLVRTIAWNDPAFLVDNAPAIVGQPIVDPAGYHDPACGGPQVLVPGGVYAPAPVHDIAARTGPIIPVNRDNPATDLDDLVVGFFQRGAKLYDPVTGQAVPNGICWPHQAVRYRPQWPTNAPHLVIASQQGTGAIDPATFVDWELYVQNDPQQAGFNPNDEHALRRPFGAAEGVFALRDDLATPATSEPFVLIRYRDPAAGGEYRMKVWQVVAEEAPFFFHYPARAGSLLQAPFPLDTLAVAPPSTGVSGPYWRDRKLSFWARAAGDDGGPADIVLRYFYPVQNGFFFPGTNPPPVGANVPLLDLRAGTPGRPIDIHYDTTWPSTVPELRVGETLVKAKNGLPQIAGQSSVEILYQQSMVREEGPSVDLIDPLRARRVPLTQLPPDVATRARGGVLHFPALPPHLEDRLTYDPATHFLELKGQFVEPPAGESYLLLNVLSTRDKALLLGLTADAPFQAAVENLAGLASDVLRVPPESTGFDSLALTAGRASGLGYVTLAFGNSTNLSAPSEPVSVSLLRVTCPLYRGELKAIASPNPFAEQLTLRHSGDFAGRPEDFEFEWRTLPPVNGLPSTLPPEQWVPFQPNPATGVGALDLTISGPGLYTLSDNYFIARYRRVNGSTPCGSGFSEWTAPMLAEGWIKRVLAGIGPFEQRIQDYQDTQVNTIVGMISQAGARAVGDVALTAENANQAGLIEIYETVLRRGIALSIEGATPVDYPPANDALLLAAGRLADLYMLLGNEAYADAADPTIAFGTEDGVYGAQATSLHCFMNQTASLLEEELALLRGRDNSRLPSVQTHPVYNRLIWNFTRDLSGGEVAYALNYNIRNQNGDVAGTIDEADARRLYPQGHGDAWGHYLTAIKNYYRLLRHPNFTWVPRAEAILVGGVPVSVDYLDERKFAAAAAARARTGAEVVNLTFRDSYTETPARPWQGRPDSDPNRAWGIGEWASRAGQGAFFDWVAANAMLPDVDPNPNHTGIQKIERANIRELPEIAEAFRAIQEQADQADSGRNPLGLANNVVPFDIDPGAITAGKTHFEQISDRANKALENAVAVFNHANDSTQLLRRQADTVNDFQQQVQEREADLNNRLIEIFGTPYDDDIGPTGTYPTGYNGADIYHYDYVDEAETPAPNSAPQPELTLQLTNLDVTASGALTRNTFPLKLRFSANGFGLQKPAEWTGQRRAPGEIQLSRLAGLEALSRLQRAIVEYENLVAQIEDQAALLQASDNLSAAQISIRNGQLQELRRLNDQIEEQRSTIRQINGAMETARIGYHFIAEAFPRVIGLATDAFSLQSATILMVGRTAEAFARDQIQAREAQIATTEDAKGVVGALSELTLTAVQAGFTHQERLSQIEQLVRQQASSRLELDALLNGVHEAFGRYQGAVARGLRLLEERTRFRQQTAAQVQTYRYKDMAFRVFRSDALQKYRAQFDLAATYAYLAAKAYDYETCLAPNDNRGPGSTFLTSIIRSRALGRFSNGTPLPSSGVGDPGLTDPLARMAINWNLVLKGQLGFNNPQTETGRFSMRNELFRIVNGPGGSQLWREALERNVVANVLDLPEFQRYCIPFTPTQPVEPAIVIPFGTTINFGMNFFGWPAGGGDNDYDSTKFATKIRSVGVWFANYNNLGGGMINTPRVYLVPVGLDVMRAPTQGQPFLREWHVLDQALPVPFPLGGGDLGDPSWIPINDSLNEDFAAIRRFGRFRAFHDSGNFNPAETITDSRLIGRSVWNTRWLLIIPAGTLHTDRNEGIQRFINGGLRADGTRDGNGVTDIKLFFQTYAYSGN